jgi:hypothetical protein
MRRGCTLLVLCLVLSAPAVAQLDLDRPYVGLYDVTSISSAGVDLKSLRSAVERDRNQRIQSCHQDETQLRSRLNTARTTLKDLNASSPYDTVEISNSRRNLHAQIASLEQDIRDKKHECEHFIPATYEIRLARLDILQHWPGRRDSTLQVIEDGRARQRRHGDIDDIGYRKLADDQQKDVTVEEQAFRQMTGSGMMPPENQDVTVRSYIQNLATNIAKHSDLKVPLRVGVLESPDVNAIALPGGFLFLTSGLILSCETESELAGILAQQIAHIAARHSTRSSKRSLITKMFVPAAQVATGLFTGGISNAGAIYGLDYGFQGLGILTDRTLNSSNAKAQKEADQLGIQYAWNAGFDPMGLVAFLDSIGKRQDFSRSDHLLITKRPLGERLVDAFTEIQYLPVKESYVRDSVDFRLMKLRLPRS